MSGGGSSYSLTISTGSTPAMQRALLLLAGATAASVIPALWRRLQRRGVLPAAAGAPDASRSTTSSAGGGVAAYETRKAVDEYLQFHFGKPEEIMPYDCGPKVAAGLPVGCGDVLGAPALQMQPILGMPAAQHQLPNAHLHDQAVLHMPPQPFCRCKHGLKRRQ